MIGTRRHFRIQVPAGFQAELLVDFHKFIGSPVHSGDDDGQELGVVESASLERTTDEAGRPVAAIHIGIMGAPGYAIYEDTRGLGLELEGVGEVPSDPNQARKWRIAKVSRSPV